MPRGEKNKAAEAGDVASIGKTADENEMFGEALSKVGFQPAKVGRKIVAQGKRRETLKKTTSKKPDE